MPWSPDEEQHIKDAAGQTLDQIAAMFPYRTRDSVERKMRRMGVVTRFTHARPHVPESGEAVEANYIRSISGDDGWPDFLPRPIQVNIPEKTYTKPTRETYVCIHYGDVHFPFQDDAALEVLYQITADLCPDEVTCHGDLPDCYEISKYEKDPKHRASQEDENKMVAEHLGTMTHLSPFAKRRWILGNHEDRLRRVIWDMATNIPAAQLLRLPNVWEQLSWGKMVGADALGWEICDEKVVQFDKMILKHGDVVRKWSGYTAKSEWEKYGKTGISGHTHRRGVFEHRDWNGVHAWWEHGCLCDVHPSYVKDPDWQQGLLVVTWSADRERFGVEEVRIHEGEAFFRGQRYAA